MKKILTASVVALMIVGGAALPVSALSLSDIQAQIQELLTRVASLRIQMTELQGGGTQTIATIPTSYVTNPNSHRICTLLSRNLSHGMSGDDVRSVQEFLQSEGYLQVSATGYFGALTGQAIAQWQAKEGLTQVGALGPLSRERIKRWCGGGGLNNQERFSASPAQGVAPLTVVFDTWLSGFRPQSTSYTIDFGDGTQERAADCLAPADACISPGKNKHTYVSNGTYTATLIQRIIYECPPGALCKPSLPDQIVGTAVINVSSIACTKEYRPVCGSKQIYCITTPCNSVPQTYSNACMAKADGATVLYEGQCRANYDPTADRSCKSWYDGCNTCSRETPDSPAMCTLRTCFQQEKPYCTEYFDSSGNKPPTISGFSGPTTLRVNETGTWSVQASDSENGQLSYDIRWGDEANIYPYAAMSSERAFTQNTSFTHAYANSGVYTVAITLRDNAGNTALSTATVSVSNVDVTCTAEYTPVCARPSGCMNTCPSGAYCATMCQTYAPRTYGNRCLAASAHADFMHEGSCAPNDI